MNGTQQHRSGRQNTSFDDLYPQNPPGFVPGRRKSQSAQPQHPPISGIYATQPPVYNPQATQPVVARGGKQNPNVKCPCGTETYTDAKDLLVCHTCKSWNRQTLQHASHMGYDMTKLTPSQRAAHMCEQCRLDHADPFWKQFPALRQGADPRDGWIYPLTWLKRQVNTHSMQSLFFAIV